MQSQEYTFLLKGFEFEENISHLKKKEKEKKKAFFAFFLFLFIRE